MSRHLKLSVVSGSAWVAVLWVGLGLLGAPSAWARQYMRPPRGVVFVPDKLFDGEKDELDRVVLTANPRVYLYKDYRRDAVHTLVIGMPGWGGRSENFIHNLVGGFRGSGMTSGLIVAAIQDLDTGGPRYQGQGDRAHANVWRLSGDMVRAAQRLVVRLTHEFGASRVFFIGFSSGAITAPRLAVRVARKSKTPLITVGGGVSIGTGSAVTATGLRAQQQRALFVVVPARKWREPRPMRDDAWNRRNALRSYERLKAAGADVYFRTVETCRRHVDWHWGLLSQCRYFRRNNLDPGRGYYPNYWMPNPETYAYIVPFVKGETPPEDARDLAPQPCPY